MKKILDYLGAGIFIVGLFTGIRLIFLSNSSLVLGIVVIVFSIFMYAFCEWLSQMLENSKEQTRLLKVISNSTNKEFEEVEVKVEK